MEIKLNIPENGYIQPTEIREDVVQKICDAFLNRRAGYYHDVFHPYSESGYRVRTLGVVTRNNGRAYAFGYKADLKGETIIKFHGSEMKAAFQALIKAGYHMFRVYEYGSWMGYICAEKPFYKDGTEVREFNDFID